jgi:mRNA interferase YafQ
MRTISWSNPFQRDYRRIKKGRYGPILDEELRMVTDALAVGQPLEPRHRDHALIGNWLACRDCHLRPDLVLIYRVTPDSVEFLRLGSHSDLFE